MPLLDRIIAYQIIQMKNKSLNNASLIIRRVLAARVLDKALLAIVRRFHKTTILLKSLSTPRGMPLFLVACRDSISHSVGPSVGRLVSRSVTHSLKSLFGHI